MVGESLYDVLLERLVKEPPTDPTAAELVAAAWEGRESLEAQLAGTGLGAPEPAAAARTNTPGVYLLAVEVEGFRGAGPPVKLEFAPGPGLTLVVGRNGSGKSTLAEALEVLLTGTTMRWEERSKVWSEGWRNLQGANAPRIKAEFHLEGRETPLELERHWADKDQLKTVRLTIDGDAASKDLSDLGWSSPLVSYRPFLSYSELSTLLTGRPTQLHDALHSILGLDQMTTLHETLRAARLEREKALKEAGEALQRIKPRLEGSSDERAGHCLEALRDPHWDLDRLEKILEGTALEHQDSELGILRGLASIELPKPEDVAAGSERLTRALAAATTHEGSDIERGLSLADLLDAAVSFHEAHDDADCPVCGAANRLNPDWAARTREQVTVLRDEATELRAAKDEVQAAANAAKALIRPLPGVVVRTDEVGLDGSSVSSAWKIWHAGLQVTSEAELVNHLGGSFPLVARTVEKLKDDAGREIGRREDAWRPVARELRDWLVVARPALAGGEQVSAIKTGETWVKSHTQALRDARLAPIFDKVQHHWSQLRQNSSVTLYGMRLEGATTTRRVELDVAVDGQSGSALGVMSQGELNCLALSMFLPRATLPESPFRFVVIDDPVQAMDPTKVDGLARVFGEVAHDRQVIVLTHDERLPEAVRRLQVPATIVEVTRREGSVIELRQTLDPVSRAIQDALAVARTDNLPAGAARVVPGLCRVAIEAASGAVVRRRRLTRGQEHDALEVELLSVTTLNQWLSLALFDSPIRGGEILKTLANRYGRDVVDNLQALKEGAHKGTPRDLDNMVRLTDRLTREILKLP